MKAEELDQLFDEGGDMVPHLDLSRVKRINSRSKKVKALDVEAQKIGVTRQSIIKVWVAERLKEEANQRAAG